MGEAGKRASARVSAVNREARSLHILIGEVSAGLYRAREQELRSQGIPMMHSAVLFTLKIEDGPLSPAQISRRLLRRHQSILQLLGRTCLSPIASRDSPDAC